jgi:hypothetical protein
VPAVPSCLLEPIWGEFAARLPPWVTMFSRWAVPAARSNRWSAVEHGELRAAAAAGLGCW